MQLFSKINLVCSLTAEHGQNSNDFELVNYWASRFDATCMAQHSSAECGRDDTLPNIFLVFGLWGWEYTMSLYHFVGIVTRVI
jgi:hypothetical protein